MHVNSLSPELHDEAKEKEKENAYSAFSVFDLVTILSTYNTLFILPYQRKIKCLLECYSLYQSKSTLLAEKEKKQKRKIHFVRAKGLL